MSVWTVHFNAYMSNSEFNPGKICGRKTHLKKSLKITRVKTNMYFFNSIPLMPSLQKGKHCIIYLSIQNMTFGIKWISCFFVGVTFRHSENILKMPQSSKEEMIGFSEQHVPTQRNIKYIKAYNVLQRGSGCGERRRMFEGGRVTTASNMSRNVIYMLCYLLSWLYKMISMNTDTIWSLQSPH